MVDKPRISSKAELELQKAEKQLEAFESQVTSLTLDRMNEAPKQELEPQTKLASSEIEKSKDIYLKPIKTVSSREKFNEDYRDQYNFDKEYVHFIAENKEVIGESLDMWTKPYAGMPAEEWKVPVNKPVWGPRYLAEQIRRKTYHRLVMQENRGHLGGDGFATYQGSIVADTTVARLTAEPVSTRKSVFMSSKGF